MTIHRGTGAIAGVLALLAALAAPATAQLRAGLVDPNKVAENELAQLPNMTPAIVKTMLERRPFKTVIELNRFLLDQKLTPDQAKAFYGKAFVPINLNTGTKDEFMLIPGPAQVQRLFELAGVLDRLPFGPYDPRSEIGAFQGGFHGALDRQPQAAPSQRAA